MILLAAFFMAISTFFTVLLIIIYLQKTRSVDLFRRLRRHYSEEIVKGGDDESFSAKLYKLIQQLAKPLTNLNFAQRIELKLRQAGLPLLGSEFIVIAALISAVTGALLYLLTLTYQVAIAGVFAVLAALWAVVMILIGNRRDSFTEQLGDCLTTVSNALRAGYSFQQAVEVIAKEMEPPISSEFAHVSADISMGINLEDALEQMARRIESSDFDLVVTAVLIQREVGGNLAQVLDSISDTINERIRMKREIRSLTAQGRMSAMVLLALPFAVAAFMYFFNHDNFMMLFEDELGQIAVGVSFVMEVIGIFVIKNIVDIEV